MERLTNKNLRKEMENTVIIEVPWAVSAWVRLADIEDILGEDYDLDRLKELVEADRNHLLKEQKTQTNADKIRSMTDEELADFLDKCEGKGYQDSSITPINEDGYPMDMLDWLKQPAKE